MMLDFIFIFILIIFILVIVLSISSRGYLGKIGKIYSVGPSNQGANIYTWTPFFVDQKESPNRIFISISKIGVHNESFYISYVFPFNLFLPTLSIQESDIKYCLIKKKFGFEFFCVSLKRAPEGNLWIPCWPKNGLELLHAFSHGRDN